MIGLTQRRQGPRQGSYIRLDRKTTTACRIRTCGSFNLHGRISRLVDLRTAFLLIELWLTPPTLTYALVANSNDLLAFGILLVVVVHYKASRRNRVINAILLQLCRNHHIVQIQSKEGVTIQATALRAIHVFFTARMQLEVLKMPCLLQGSLEHVIHLVDVICPEGDGRRDHVVNDEQRTHQITLFI